MKTNDIDKSVSQIAGRGLVLVGLLAVALAFGGEQLRTIERRAGA